MWFSDVRMADRNISITQKFIPTSALNRSKVIIFRRWLVEIKPDLYANKKREKERWKRKEEEKERNERKKKEKKKEGLMNTH